MHAILAFTIDMNNASPWVYSIADYNCCQYIMLSKESSPNNKNRMLPFTDKVIFRDKA